jgi:hypothetical protein
MPHWVDPPLYLPTMEFDYSICYDAAYLDSLLSSALEPLPSHQINDLTIKIKQEPTVLNLLNQSFSSGILENNPKLAIEIIKLNQTATFDFSLKNWIELLYEKCLDLQTMETVKELITLQTIPDDFIYMFLDKLMHKVKTLEQSNMERIARLICLFATFLVKNGFLDTRNTGLKSFCLEFSMLKEAILLYKLL